jgi:hypothetical protein
MPKYTVEFTAKQDADLKLAVGQRKLGPMQMDGIEPATDDEVAAFLMDEARSCVQSYLHRAGEAERNASTQTQLEDNGWVEPTPEPGPVPMPPEPAVAKEEPAAAE